MAKIKGDDETKETMPDNEKKEFTKAGDDTGSAVKDVGSPKSYSADNPSKPKTPGRRKIGKAMKPVFKDAKGGSVKVSVGRKSPMRKV